MQNAESNTIFSGLNSTMAISLLIIVARKNLSEFILFLNFDSLKHILANV